MKIVLSIILLCGTALAMAASHAGPINVNAVVVNSDDAKTWASSCKNTKGYYGEVGMPSNDDNQWIVDAKFDGTKIEYALKQMAPDGWTVDIGSNLSKDQAITWTDKEGWQTALKNFAVTFNMVVLLDWNRKHIFVDKL